VELRLHERGVQVVTRRAAPVNHPVSMRTLAAALRGPLPPLPLLTVLNYLNYLDRQIVYGMLGVIGPDLSLNKYQLGFLATVNLLVFAASSMLFGLVADRFGARAVIFGSACVWTLATAASALAPSYGTLLFCRALVGVGEGAYGPSANALLCSTAPEAKRGSAMATFNVGMALGGLSGLVLGALLGPAIGWRPALLLAAVPGVPLTLAILRLADAGLIGPRTGAAAWPAMLSPTFLAVLGGGILGTFGASGLIVWSERFLIQERQLPYAWGAAFILATGLLCGAGGVVAGGWAADRVRPRHHGAYALVIGVSFVLGAATGWTALYTPHRAVFLVLVAATVFFLSVYNGPAAAIIHELAPPEHAATLQGNFLFGIHLLGNAPAPAAVGWVADRSSVTAALQIPMAAFLVAGLLFLWAARQRAREAAPS
jgi:predicted MFS family arabinose efflux permease